MKAKRLLLSSATLLLALTACQSTDPEHEPSVSEGPPTVTPSDAPSVRPTPNPTPSTVAPKPGHTPQAPEPDKGTGWDVAPGPDGEIPAQHVPFGQGAYRSKEYPDIFEPHQWDSTLVEVVCDMNPTTLSEEFREDLADPYIPRPDTTLCAVTISYEHIGTTPGIPDLPAGVVVDSTVHEQPDDPALHMVNNLLFDQAFGEEFGNNDVIEAVTYLEAPNISRLEAIYLGPDASLNTAWLLVE